MVIKSAEFFKLIEIIVEKYHNIIKIWNLSISLDKTSGYETIWNEGISSFGMKLDAIQKKYKIIFIIASGNKNEDFKWITSPSDSMMSICVVSANNKGLKTNYSLSGNYKDNKYFSNKPDIAVKGIDEIGCYPVISEGCYCNKQGTSYATPFITRKVAELFSEGIELYAIPAILNAVAIFYNNNNKNDDNEDIYADNYLGYGCVPQNIDYIKSLCNENCMIVSKINVNDYNQGFFKLNLPINENNKFDLNIILSANIKAKFCDIPSFEYVEDTVRVQFGAVDPFANNGYRLHKNWKLSEIRGDSDDAGIKEESLRKLYNKYKNRYCSAKFLKRNKQSYIIYNGEKRDIKNWGLTFTRNDIRSKREEPIEVYFCLILSSLNNIIFMIIFIMKIIYI